MSAATKPVEQADGLPAEVRGATRDLILCLADSKRLLGMRYADWILGAPALEAGIACASMAQDEWGHARQLYAILRDFGEDAAHLEHGREPADYCCVEVLDREPGGWPALIALNALVDTALSEQFRALAQSTYTPLQTRVEKLLEEERFHEGHGAAWLRRLMSGPPDLCDAMRDAVRGILPPMLRWFGPDSERAESLVQSGVASAAGPALRQRYLDRVAPLLDVCGVEAAEPMGDDDFGGFDEARRRGPGGAPDARTIEQVRGDRNRVFLMD